LLVSEGYRRLEPMNAHSIVAVATPYQQNCCCSNSELRRRMQVENSR
jgi:hypothetical protein